MPPTKHALINYHLTTAEITYHLPDHPELLQNFIWQEFDLAPQYPMLRQFLRFWQGNLDGRLHSVTVAATTLVQPRKFRFARSVSDTRLGRQSLSRNAH